MSWLNWSTSSTRSGNPNFTQQAREERRAKLEAERLIKAQKKADRQAFFKAGISAPPSPVSLSKSATPELQDSDDEETKSLPDIFLIASDIFQEFKMVNFDSKNEDNGADAMKNLGQIKISWDSEDPSYFFSKLETELQIFGIGKQFTKRQALIRNLPDEVAKEFKHLVTLEEDAAGDLPYKTLKQALIKAYGPRPGAAFKRALGRVMISKPSVLLKLLVADICKQNLSQNCCCSTTVWGLFQEKIPLYLKNGLADEVLSATTLQHIQDRADNLWSANQSEEQIAEVTAVTAKTSATATSPEVAAVGRGRGYTRPFRGYRGGRGNRGGKSQKPDYDPKNDPRGKRHESNPPWNSCKAHWLHAEKAWACQSPLTCPMKDKITPKA